VSETGPARRTPRRWLGPLSLLLVLGAVYTATLLPGPGYSPDTAEMQFSGRLLCVTHPTGYPTYLLLSHAFSRLVPVGSIAWRANLFSALCGVLACLVVRRLLLRLGARDAVATATAMAFGLTPTFWRLSVVAEVYTLHALFFALVLDGMLRWRETGKPLALVAACGAYAFSFGNHLTSVTLLPALAFLVLATRPRVLVERRVVAPVLALVVLGALQYAYPVLRSLDPGTPYLAQPVTNLGELWAYATGASFRREMFAFTPAELVGQRVPLFLRHLWADCAVLLPAAALGAVSFKDRVAGAFLALAFAGHLAFSLNYAIADIDVYFVPAYLVTALAAGVGLERLFSWPGVRRVPALACLALPLGLGLAHWQRVEAARGPGMAEPMRELIEHTGGRGLIVSTYNEYMYLLYFTLVERLGEPTVFVSYRPTAADIAAYLRRDQPVYLAPLRRRVPYGLPVYSTRLELRGELKAAGLRVTPLWPGLYRVDDPARRPEPGR